MKPRDLASIYDAASPELSAAIVELARALTAAVVSRCSRRELRQRRRDLLRAAEELTTALGEEMTS